MFNPMYTEAFNEIVLHFPVHVHVHTSLTSANNVLGLVYCISSSSCTTSRHADLKSGITLAVTHRISVGVLICSSWQCATSKVDVIPSNGTRTVRKRSPWYDYFVADLLRHKVNWVRRIYKQIISTKGIVLKRASKTTSIPYANLVDKACKIPSFPVTLKH